MTMFYDLLELHSVASLYFSEGLSMFIDRHPIKLNAMSVFDHPLHKRRCSDDLTPASLNAQRERSEERFHNSS